MEFHYIARHNDIFHDLTYKQTQLNRAGYPLANLCKKAGWNRIAIYGGGNLGQFVYEELFGTGVEITTVIDVNKNVPFPYPVKITHPTEAGTLDVDVIMITTLPMSPNRYVQHAYEVVRPYTELPIVDYKTLVFDPIWVKLYQECKSYVRDCGAQLFELSIPHNLPSVYAKNRTIREKTLGMITSANKIYESYGMFLDLYQYKEDLTHEFIMEIFTAPPLKKTINGYVNVDVKGKYHNNVNGVRITTDCPENYDNTINIYGPCMIYGIGAEDSMTVASQLQRMVNETPINDKAYRVVNYGVWGDREIPPLSRIMKTKLVKGDICAYFTPLEPGILELYDDSVVRDPIVAVNVTSAFDRPHDKGEVLIDCAHFTELGAGLLAGKCYDILRREIRDIDESENANSSISQSPNVNDTRFSRSTPMRVELVKYLDYLKKEKIDRPRKVGSIVMNCNPFTLGHQYLIENATKQVDFLYIFCLEGKSFFSFPDRFIMLSRGTASYPNVKVLRGGNFIISTLTFPDYFMKDDKKAVTSPPTLDLDLFANYIAPTLDISVRFAGTEPTCDVTSYYNSMMKDVLPTHGIEFREMDRVCTNGTPVSASLVRKHIKENNLAAIAELVPPTTYDYIVKMAATGSLAGC